MKWLEFCNLKQVAWFQVQWRVSEGQKTPMKVSFSVSINELIPRILKVGAGAYLIFPNNPPPPQQPRSSWKK